MLLRVSAVTVARFEPFVVLALKRILTPLLVMASHVTYTLLPTEATWGAIELEMVQPPPQLAPLLMIVIIGPKLVPLFVLARKSMLLLVSETFCCQTI